MVRKTRKKSKRQLRAGFAGFGNAFSGLQAAMKARTSHTMNAIREQAEKAKSAATEQIGNLQTQATGQFNNLKTQAEKAKSAATEQIGNLQTQATSAIDNVSKNIKPQEIHQNINNNMAHVSNLGKQHLNTIHTNTVQGAHQLGNHIGTQRDNITQAALQGKQQLGVHANTIRANTTQGMRHLGNHIGNQYKQLNNPKKLDDLKNSTNVQLNRYPKGGSRKRKHNKRQKTHRKKRGGGGDYSIKAIETMKRAMRKAHGNRKSHIYKATTQKTHPSKLLKNRSRIKSYPNKSPGRGGRKTKRRKR